jgi:formate dehydrogenase subunit delta
MTDTSHASTEKREKLAHMAGQIADFFKAYPDEQAAPAIADHINQFWSRRMRADFIAAFESAPEALPPLLRAALPALRRTPAE